MLVRRSVGLVLLSMGLGYLLHEVPNPFFTKPNQGNLSLSPRDPDTENDPTISFGILGTEQVIISKGSRIQTGNIYLLTNSVNAFFIDASPPSYPPAFIYPGSSGVREPSLDISSPQDYEGNLRGRNLGLF